MLVAQAAARQDHRRVSRVADMDGKAGRHQVGAAGRDGQRLADGGAQVEAGAARGRIGRQQFFHAGIKYLDVDFFHGSG